MPTPLRLLQIPVLILLGLLTATALPAQDANDPSDESANLGGLFPSVGGGETFRILGPIRTVENRAYTDQRTTLLIGDLTVEADRMVIDFVTLEVLAEGDVLVKEGEDLQLRASRIEYDRRSMQGMAYDANGRTGDLFFFASPNEEEGRPTFRRVNADQTTFRGVRLTANSFPKPMWYIHSSEAVLVENERFSLRNPVLYIRGLPVFWLPYYSRSFDQGSPWNFETGFISEYGAYTRIRYQLSHRSTVPGWFDPTKTRTRSFGVLGIRSDLFTSGTIGIATDYRYSLNFEQHIGELSLYGVRDTQREEIAVDGGESDEGEDRWFYRHKHNSMFGRTIWQLNVDWMSDADIYYDLYDPFTLDETRGRRPERGYEVAGSYVQRNWLARASARFRERLSRDRLTDFTDPRDDDLDYDADVDFLDGEDADGDGISEDRFGKVTERFQGTLATNMMTVGRSPFYWQGRANVFQATDAGFNQNNENDDVDFTGFDAYNSISNLIRLDPRGRVTWLNTVGIGAGNYDRDSTDLVASGSDFPTRLTDEEIDELEARVEAEEEGAEEELNEATRGAKFLSPSEVYLGQSDRLANYDDVDSQMVWADYVSRLSARFSNDLAGYLQYTYRRTTDDGPDQFYRRIGRVEAFEDIYNFPTNSHWIETALNYFPVVPFLETSWLTGYNLDTGEDEYANDRKWYTGITNEFTNATEEFNTFLDFFLENRQIRDPEDPDAFEQSVINATTGFKYIPIHQRWWTGLDISGQIPLDEDPVDADNRERQRFDENETDVNIRPLFGRQFGPKYRVEAFVEYNTRISDIRSAGVTIVRDLVDADLLLFLGVRNNNNDFDDDDTDSSTAENDFEPQFRVSLALKVGGGEAQNFGDATQIGTLIEPRRLPSYVE
jgi:hypothetical protein